MLHILWLILKFILIALGSILGLLLLLFLLVLFCPFCYEADVSKETESFKEAEGGGGVSWLFHLISVKARYAAGKLDLNIRVFGIPVLKVLKWIREKKKKRSSEPKKEEKTESAEKAEKIAEKPAEFIAEETTGQDSENPIEENPPALEESTEQFEEIPASESEVIEQEARNPEEAKQEEAKPEETKPEEVPAPESDKKPAETVKQEKKKEKKKKRKKKPEKPEAEQLSEEEKVIIQENPVQKISNKIKALVQKLTGMYQNLEETRERLGRTIQKWKQFLGHERTRAAIAFVKKALKRIILHILPVKITGEITFGTEDPELMGKVLAALAITIPFHKNAIKVHPVFEEGNMLTGHVKMKGRIYVIVFVWTGLCAILNKNIRFVIRHLKK